MNTLISIFLLFSNVVIIYGARKFNAGPISLKRVVINKSGLKARILKEDTDNNPEEKNVINLNHEKFYKKLCSGFEGNINTIYAFKKKNITLPLFWKLSLRERRKNKTALNKKTKLIKNISLKPWNVEVHKRVKRGSKKAEEKGKKNSSNSNSNFKLSIKSNLDEPRKNNKRKISSTEDASMSDDDFIKTVVWNFANMSSDSSSQKDEETKKVKEFMKKPNSSRKNQKKDEKNKIHEIDHKNFSSSQDLEIEVFIKAVPYKMNPNKSKSEKQNIVFYKPSVLVKTTGETPPYVRIAKPIVSESSLPKTKGSSSTTTEKSEICSLCKERLKFNGLFSDEEGPTTPYVRRPKLATDGKPSFRRNKGPTSTTKQKCELCSLCSERLKLNVQFEENGFTTPYVRRAKPSTVGEPSFRRTKGPFSATTTERCELCSHCSNNLRVLNRPFSEEDEIHRGPKLKNPSRWLHGRGHGQPIESFPDLRTRPPSPDRVVLCPVCDARLAQEKAWTRSRWPFLSDRFRTCHMCGLMRGQGEPRSLDEVRRYPERYLVCGLCGERRRMREDGSADDTRLSYVTTPFVCPNCAYQSLGGPSHLDSYVDKIKMHDNEMGDSMDYYVEDYYTESGPNIDVLALGDTMYQNNIWPHLHLGSKSLQKIRTLFHKWPSMGFARL